MARLAYGDLTVGFTIGASSTPTQTQITALITKYYKLVYSRWYGNGTYSADESTDTIGFIDSDEFREELGSLISAKVQLWHEAGEHSDGTVTPMPRFNLFYNSSIKDEKRYFITTIDNMVASDDDVEYIDNVRTMGSDYTDYEGIY